MAKINIFNSYVPRWLVFVFDLAICTISIVFAYVIRFNFQSIPSTIAQLNVVIPVLLAIRAISLISSKSQ